MPASNVSGPGVLAVAGCRVFAAFLALALPSVCIAQSGTFDMGEPWPIMQGAAGAPRSAPQHGRAGDWLRQHRSMSPQQQEQTLRNDPQFQQLPKDHQQKLLNRLHTFDNLPPQEQEKILNRMQEFESLPPAEQAKLHLIQHRIMALPQDRQTAVRKAFRRLHEMSPEERDRVMSSDHFKSLFNDSERGILNDWIAIPMPKPAPRSQPPAEAHQP